MTYDWRHRAVCRDEDPELFFPVGNSGPAQRQIAEAKAVCRRCPVASECLNWTLNNDVKYGVFGGATESERDAMLRTRRPKPNRSRIESEQARLSDLDIELMLQRLDAGHRAVPVAKEFGVNQEVCRRVWRENRDTANPPGHNCTQVRLTSPSTTSRTPMQEIHTTRQPSHDPGVRDGLSEDERRDLKRRQPAKAGR